VLQLLPLLAPVPLKPLQRRAKTLEAWRQRQGVEGRGGVSFGMPNLSLEQRHRLSERLPRGDLIRHGLLGASQQPRAKGKGEGQRQSRPTQRRRCEGSTAQKQGPQNCRGGKKQGE
jgi:hypothetical protein